MKFTDLFVKRPVLALVVSTLILLAGLFALNKLPIRQYPQLKAQPLVSVPNTPAHLLNYYKVLLLNRLHKPSLQLKGLII